MDQFLDVKYLQVDQNWNLTRDLDQKCNFEANPARDTESFQTFTWTEI